MNPGYVNGISNRNTQQISRLMKYSREIKRILHINRSLLATKNSSEIKQNDYDEVWQKILQLRPIGTTKMIPCAFTDWDNSPRFGINGSCYTGVTPQNSSTILHYW